LVLSTTDLPDRHSVAAYGYDGIDQQAFHPLVRAHVAGKRFPGWIHLPEQATE
jgi:hypothetical protein